MPHIQMHFSIFRSICFSLFMFTYRLIPWRMFAAGGGGHLSEENQKEVVYLIAA